MSSIKSDERVVFFPTAASLGEDGQTWLVPIHGCIFEPETNDAIRNAFVATLRNGLDLESGDAATQIFDQRIRLFLVDHERGKRVGIRLAGATHVLDKSTADGHFHGTIAVAHDAVAKSSTQGLLRFEAQTDATDSRQFQGICICLAPEGISVISDLDDTVKVTEVTDKRKAIVNTFFREFRAVEGMADVYCGWAKQGAAFHFVSSSPWQLYEPLANFLQESGFPRATFHLRRFRIQDTGLSPLFENPTEYKLAQIEPLIKAFRRRKFILVGDSGEQDPEAYGIIARRYTEQVLNIYIRDVTAEPVDAARYLKAFHGLPTDQWKVFKDPNKLPSTLPTQRTPSHE